MKLITLLLLFGIPSWAIAFDISIPASKLIESGGEWKYGIKIARKNIGTDSYFSISVNERLLCPLIWVDAVGRSSSGSTVGLDIVKHENEYAVKVDLKKIVQLDFYLSCNEYSNVHQVRRFKLVAWLRETL